MCNTQRWQDLSLGRWPCHDLVAGLVFKALTAGESHGCCKGAIRHVWSHRYVSQRFSGGSMRPLGCQSGAGTEYNLSTLFTVLSRQKEKNAVQEVVWFEPIVPMDWHTTVNSQKLLSVSCICVKTSWFEWLTQFCRIKQFYLLYFLIKSSQVLILKWH